MELATCRGGLGSVPLWTTVVRGVPTERASLRSASQTQMTMVESLLSSLSICL
jgi:hypothetical protein